MLFAYRETRRRKHVRPLFTACRAELNDNGKPKMIEFYNTIMGAVGLSDPLASAYKVERKNNESVEKLYLILFKEWF